MFQTGRGGDICGAIANAFSKVTSAGRTSATIDARGYTGTQYCSSLANGPIPTSGVHGVVLIGSVKIITAYTWVIPAGVELVGLGALNTTIQAGLVGGHSFSDPQVLEMGYTSVNNPQYDVKIRALTVDCNAISNCVGIHNARAEEASFVEDVIVDNASTGLKVTVGGTLADNSGPYRNITVQYSQTGCCAGAVGILATGSDAGQIIRGFDNITVSACNTAASSAGVGVKVVGAATRISNVTVSCLGNGSLTGAIQIGDASSTTTHNVQVENAYVQGPSSTGIYAAANTSNLFLSNVGSTTNVTALLDDQVTINSSTRQLAGPFLGFYIRGECNGAGCQPQNGPNAALATSAARKTGGTTNLSWVSPDGTCSGSGNVGTVSCNPE